MIKHKMKINSSELAGLVNNLEQMGEKLTYDMMKKKTFSEINTVHDIDFIVMNMYEIMLERARAEEKEETKATYYTLSSMLRKLAHELRSEQILRNKIVKKDNRFLRIVK